MIIFLVKAKHALFLTVKKIGKRKGGRKKKRKKGVGKGKSREKEKKAGGEEGRRG